MSVESPDGLAAILKRDKDSLGKANPDFPPGTFIIASRHFTRILRPMDRVEARHFAELAGGIIAVPATEEEADGISESCKHLEAPDGFWLGGMKSDFLWRWDSGEPWIFDRWAGAIGHDVEDSALVWMPAG